MLLVSVFSCASFSAFAALVGPSVNVCQCVSVSVLQSGSQSVSQSVSQPGRQPASQPAIQSLSQSASERARGIE